MVYYYGAVKWIFRGVAQFGMCGHELALVGSLLRESPRYASSGPRDRKFSQFTQFNNGVWHSLVCADTSLRSWAPCFANRLATRVRDQEAARSHNLHNLITGCGTVW